MKNILYISVLLFGSNILIAQKSNGVVQGTVYDASNNMPIEFASVAIYGTNFGSITDDKGNFTFNNVPPGFIEIRVTALGFEPYISEQLRVTNAGKTFVEVKMVEATQQIEEVVVKASPFRRDKESPVSLRNIGLKEIEKSPGGNRDISRVIQSFPGVASTPNYRNDVVVRGGGASENRFYLDGIEIPNLNHFATQGSSGGAVGIINADLIREVSFYSGAFPADKGNALSSILDIKQIEGNSEKVKVKSGIGASDFALTLDGPIGENTNFILSARRSYLQFLFSVLELPFLPIYNDYQIKVKTRLDNKNELTFMSIGAYDVSDLNLEANKTEKQKYILSYLPAYSQWNYTIGATYKHFHEHSYDTWVVSRSMLNNNQIKYANNIELPENKLLDYNSFETENKFRYEYNRANLLGLKVIAGAGFEYARYYNSTYRKLFGGEDLYKSDFDLFKWNFFGQASKELLDKKLTISFGLRSDANNYTSQMKNFVNQFSPRLSVSYALTQSLTLNSSVGRYYQLPSYTTLGYRDTLGVLINKFNNLKYMQADHIVAGFDILPTSNSKFSIEGFYKNYSNYPFSIRDGIALAGKTVDYGTYGDEPVTSTGVGRAYGAELLYQNRDLMGANVMLSYTLVRSEFKTAYGGYSPSAWDNKHLLNILVAYEFRNNWTVGSKFRLVGGAPYTPVDIQRSSLVEAWDVNNQAYLDYSRFNSLRLKAFHQMDIRVDKEFFFNRWSLTAYMDIQNVYNFKSDSPPTYLVDRSVPIIPNPDRYTLKTLENDGGGTILPTVGVIIEF
ncbi:MAG TPA: TonB-dependent receptor [Bacteroidales bacterium]|nr:TonB-dependent receptor [Bacteroidales bacterium]